MMKISFNKKGLEEDAVVFLALMVALIVFLFIYLGNIKDASNRSVEDTACWASVVRNERLHIRGFEFPINLDCPAKQIEITETKSDAAQEAAKKTIAESMYNCWYNYGEGKRNLFIDEGTYCAVCSFIDVKSEEPIKGLTDYLLTQNIPDGSGRDYASYLAGYSTSRAKEIIGAIKSDTSEAQLGKKAAAELPGKKKYATIFVYAKGNDWQKRLLNHLTVDTAESKVGIATGALFGGIAGSAAGGVAAGLIVLGIGSGPPGWIALGVTAIGMGAGAVYGWVVSFFGTPKVPEWAAMTVLREWNSGDTQKFLEGFGCEYFPAELEGY